MSEILPFESFDSTRFQNICVNLFSRLNSLYIQEEKNLNECDKTLYQKVQKILPKILKNSWLTIKERKLFIEKIEPFLKEEDINEFLFLIHYTYLSDTNGISFLKQDISSMRILMETFINGEIPYTSYEKVVPIFFNSEFLNKLSLYKNNKSHLLISMIEDINFDLEKDLVLTNSFHYLDEHLNSVELTHDSSMKSIYEYYLLQMQSVNEYLCESDNPIFKPEEFTMLKKILKLNGLTPEHQQNFYSTLAIIEKNNGLIEVCKLLINMIDFYLPLVENIVYSNQFGGCKK